MFSFQGRASFLAVLLVFMAGVARPEDHNGTPPETLSADQIVVQMEHHSASQREGLKRYHAVRHYQVEYRGFTKTIAASMEVDVEFDVSSGKSFRILSQSGSKFLCDKVLKRAVDSEKEASKDRDATALTPANYRFKVAGSETLGGRLAYIMQVDPVANSKFLYRGKIWVDAQDFAVVKIEAEPAKNPSFWISRTLIRSTSSKTGSFWLPKQNRSETKVRIGGTAVLTNDYGDYQINTDVLRSSAGD